MRVLHVIESLECGGAEKVVVDLAHALLERCEVTVCCLRKRGEMAAELDSRVRVICLNKSEGNDWRIPFKLARIVREGCFDVIHSHIWNVYLECALGAMLARRARLVHTVHGSYMQYAPGLASRIKMALRHLLERRFAGRHEKIVTVSNTAREYVIRDVRIPKGKVLTIHNGIRCGGGHSARGDGSTFVTVGRLAAVKNHEMMLRAFANVVEKHPAARLRIVGDGPERQNLEASAGDLGIKERVEFLGYRNDVALLLENADVFLLSSRYEGISIAILEAMCVALPVIATRVGGNAETVKNGTTGLLVADDNSDELAKAMERLLEEPATRIRFGEAGRKHMAEEFSIERMVDRYFRLYRGLG